MTKQGIRINCKCDYCGKDLALTSALYKGAKKHFCSMLCRYAMRAENRTKVNCLHCGKKLLISPYYVKTAKKHFCNRSCYKAWNSSHILDVPCSFCGKLLQRNIHTVKRNEYNYCSQSCRGAWISENRKAEKHHNWKGGRHIASGGYIKVFKPDYCNSDSKGYILEHRYILEQKLGRSLKRDEVVHHLNGIRDDNRIENLFLTEINKHETNTVQKIYMTRIRLLESMLSNIYGCPN